MGFLLSTLLLLLVVQGINSLWTVRKTTAQSGGSVTIPCHYHRLHKDLPKLWCKGKNWITCLIMRPSNQAKRTGVSFYNSPDELVTTMTLTNLRSSDSNRYWCAVKTQTSYIRTSLELSVTEDTPDLSVASNRVSGEEGGNVTIKCLYSDKLTDTEKKWCLSGDLRSCQTAQDSEPSSGSALQINDTNDGVYTVTLTGLKRTDAGWYWCMAGEVQVPVHINVDSRELFTDADTKKPDLISTKSSKQFESTTQFSSYPTTTENPKEGSGPSTHTMATSFTSSNSLDVHNHNSAATFAQTKSKLPESTWIQTKKPGQASTASPKQFSSTTQSSSSPTSSSQSSWTVRTSPSSGSVTPFLSNSTVTVSSKDLISEPTPIKQNRNLVWVIVLACAAMIILFMLPGISWKLRSWHKKANTSEEATELTRALHVNERVDLLCNEWTNPSSHSLS